MFFFDQNGVNAAGRYSRFTYTFIQILMGFKAYYVDVREGSVRQDEHVFDELELVLAEVTDEFTVRLTSSSIRNAVVSSLINSNYLAKYTFSKVPVGEPAFVIAYK